MSLISRCRYLFVGYALWILGDSIGLIHKAIFGGVISGGVLLQVIMGMMLLGGVLVIWHLMRDAILAAIEAVLELKQRWRDDRAACSSARNYLSHEFRFQKTNCGPLSCWCGAADDGSPFETGIKYEKCTSPLAWPVSNVRSYMRNLKRSAGK